MSRGTPEQVLTSIVDGINTGNLDALMPLYEPEAAFATQPGSLAHGLSGVREPWHGLSAAGRSRRPRGNSRFLINTVPDDASAPITLLQNWNPDAKEVAIAPGITPDMSPTSGRIPPAQGVGRITSRYSGSITRLSLTANMLRGFARGGTQSRCSGRTDRACCAA